MAINFDNTNVGSVTLAAPVSGTTTLQFPATIGSAGTFLTTNGSGVLSFTSSSPTLTGFVTTITTTGTFASVNRSNLDVGTLTAAASIAIVPKGSGSVMASIPDGTTTGGNSRGGSVQSVDFQLPGQRTNADQIASGNWSFIGGGYANKASGNRGVVVGGNTNWTNAAGTIVGGANNKIENLSSFSAILGGQFNQMSGSYSVIVGGTGSTAWTGDYTTVYGSSNFGSGSTFGQAQTRYMCLTQVANANANFQLNNSNVTTSGLTTVTAVQGIFVPDSSAVLVRSLIVQRRNSPVGNRAYTNVGLWKRTGSGAATNVYNSNSIYGTSGTVTSWGSSMATNTTSNTAAPIVSSTAGVASYVCGYNQILDLRYP
jgi:hypothetical protein